MFFDYNALVKMFPEVFYPQIVEQMAGIGLPGTILLILAALEILCVVTYSIPATSVLGVVLFTGYMGGTILAHLRVEQNVMMQVALGLLIWLGLYLREPRLHSLLPIRK
ncbi:MAG: DoxX family protein [Chitinophagaceae bacterium]|nr:DoxX family protein [Oligoflexus sp.]